MSQALTPYVLVTPSHNEVETLRNSIPAVFGQTHPPAYWIIVDDRSTDATTDVVAPHLERESPLIVVRLEEDTLACRWRYSGVVRVGFQEAMRQIKASGLERPHIALLDGDTIPDPDCFEQLARALDADHGLGVVGARISSPSPNGWHEETKQMDRPRGGVRMWKFQCFQSTGGFLDEPAPDSISNAKALVHGFQIGMVKRAHARQTRATGGRSHPVRYQWGRGRLRHYLGFRFGSVLRHSVAMLRTGRILQSVAQTMGFCAAAVRAQPQIRDDEVREFFGRRRHPPV